MTDEQMAVLYLIAIQESSKPGKKFSKDENITMNKKRKELADDPDTMGEMESIRLQMAMDRMSKMMSTLSNLLKKASDTSGAIIQNIK
ncbi:MAG: hypothetical protein H7Y04_10565 [Verrucomicrobia bacterium]|nr:hypothetical protein [Cytophagales bacterium]